MTDPAPAAAPATASIPSPIAAVETAAKAEVTSLWTKIVGVWNRCWPVAAALAAGYVGGVTHALSLVGL